MTYTTKMKHSNIKETYPIGTTIYHDTSKVTAKVTGYNIEGRFIFLVVETEANETREFCHSTVIPM